MQLCASNSASTGETLYSPLKISCVNGPLVYHLQLLTLAKMFSGGGLLTPSGLP